MPLPRRRSPQRESTLLASGNESLRSTNNTHSRIVRSALQRRRSSSSASATASSCYFLCCAPAGTSLISARMPSPLGARRARNARRNIAPRSTTIFPLSADSYRMAATCHRPPPLSFTSSRVNANVHVNVYEYVYPYMYAEVAMCVEITTYEYLIIAPSDADADADADAALYAEYTALATAGSSATVSRTEKKGQLRLRRSAISAHAAHSALYFCSPL